MSSPQKLVETAAELSAACKDTGARYIVVRGNILDTPSLRLGPSQTLAGEGDDAAISFTPGVDGLQLSSDNDVRSLRLIASVDKRAIFNDTAVESLGCIRLQGLAVHGQVQILARDKVRSGHVDVTGLDIMREPRATDRADLGSRSSREHLRCGTCKRTKALSSAPTSKVCQQGGHLLRLLGVASS